MTDAFDFPAPVRDRPLWLVTLADLALLLLGFVVLIQATQRMGGPALAHGLRQRFGVAAEVTPMPVASAALTGFAPGSAVPVGGTDALVAWARDSARDPRVRLTITGSTDGSAADVDSATRSASLLAADRARATAAILADAHVGARLTLTTATRPGPRGATVSLGFAGEP